MTLDEFTAWFNDPLFQRIWQIGEEVRAGRADDDTVRAWEDLQESVERYLKTAERATFWTEPKERERVLRGWVEKIAQAHWEAGDLH